MAVEVILVNMLRQLVKTQIVRGGKTLEVSIGSRATLKGVKKDEYSPLTESQLRNGILKEQPAAPTAPKGN